MRTFLSIAAAGLSLAACASNAPVPAPPSQAEPERPQSAAQQQLHEQQFLRYDLNGDGLITNYEERQYNRSEFSKLNPTEDGVVPLSCSVEDYGEMSGKYAQRHPAIMACFKNAEGSAHALTFEDYYGIFRLDGDANGDGLISRQEYRALFASK